MSSSSLLRRSARVIRARLGALMHGRRDGDRRETGRRSLSEEVTPRGVRRSDIEALVGMRVENLIVYEHALRHRSLFRGEEIDSTESNERLEFLGDAVLGAIVTEKLFVDFPDQSEGRLTRARANLVNGAALAKYAHAFELGSLLLLSDNAEASGARENATILADAFEALVGALYLDLGFAKARRFVLTVLSRCVDLNNVVEARANPKSQLLELVQANALDQPVYNVVSEEGPSHDRTFTVEVLVNGITRGSGVGPSKKAAEQEAAVQALRGFQETSRES